MTATSSSCSPTTPRTSSSASAAWTATIGIVANQPLVLAGCLDIKSSIKAARFVRFCDAFNIPVVTFVDVPGLHAGHHAGIRRHHQARRQAALRLRRVHRAEGYRDHPQGLRRRLRRDESKHLRGDVNIAWPSAEIAVMGPKGAVEIIFREERTIRQAGRARSRVQGQVRQSFVAGARGFIDDVIMPHATRKRICRSLAMLRDKQLDNPWRKHGNIPL